MWLSATVAGAVGGCFGLATLFVGSLYLAPKRIRRLAHGDDEQIRWRFMSTAATCVVSPLLLLLFRDPARPGGPGLLEWVGIRTAGLLPAAVLPLAAMVALFLGPLVDQTLAWRQSDATEGSFLERFFPNCPETAMARARNLIAAPLAEELVFRGCMGALLRSAGVSGGATIALAPLFFGVAHLHHCKGMVDHGMPLGRALLVSLVQMSYTSLFGALEMFMFLRTGHLAAVFLAHSWCNLQGLPSFAFTRPAHPNYRRRYLICAAFCAGIALFAVMIRPCTDPSLHRNTMYA